MKHLKIVGLLAAALLAGISVNLAIHTPNEQVKPVQASSGIVNQGNIRWFSPEREIKPFSLFDHQGQVFSNQAFIGHWTLAFLGYTYCPDICPTTMLAFARNYDKFQQLAPNVQVLMISADPQRDTQQTLAEYVPYFHPDFIAITGEHKALLPFTRNLSLVYSMVEGSQQQDYLVNHSASIVLINPAGKLAAMVKPNMEVTLPHVQFSDVEKMLEIALDNEK